MKTANPGELHKLAESHGYRSLRGLAASMRKCESWPAQDTRDLETVANKLRDLDKGKDIRWWSNAGQPLVAPLAEALGLDETEMADFISELGAGDHGIAPWTFQVFPALRPLDPRSDDLLPGLPRELVQRGGPRSDRTWWIAPQGAGKTLIGRWLAARGWRRVEAPTWEMAERQLPEQGPVFVELANPPPTLPQPALPRGYRLCVATGSPPTSAAASLDDSAIARDVRTGRAGAQMRDEQPWAIVHGSPPSTWARALVDWVAARVRPGGGFVADEVRSLFEEWSLWTAFETPGEMLGFLGMIDEVGIAALRESSVPSKDLLRIVRPWWRATRDRADHAATGARNAHVLERGPELLVEMNCERLRQGLGPRLSRNAWMTLVNAQDEMPVDRVELVRVLEEGGEQAVKKLKKMLACDGAAVVMGLEALGVLHGGTDDVLEIRPAWVARVVNAISLERVSTDVPAGLGAVLLYPATAPDALQSLIDEVTRGDMTRVAACVAKPPVSPEEVAALDGAVRAIGLALAGDVDVPVELVERAWERQDAWLAPRYSNWPAVPIVSTASPPDDRGVSARGAWFVAALAITRKLLDAGRALPASSIAPWNGLPLDAETQTALVTALENATFALYGRDPATSADAVRLLPFRIGAALLDRVGIIRDQGRIPAAQGPDLLVALARGESPDVSDPERDELVRLTWGLDVLDDACRRRGVPIEEVLQWCWTRWGAGGSERWPPTAWLHDDHAACERLWRIAPASALSAQVLATLEHLPDVWPWISESVWTRWLEQSTPRGPYQVRERLFSVIPEQIALAAVRKGLLDDRAHEVRAVLWKRIPGSLLLLIDELARTPGDGRETTRGGPLSHLVQATPDDNSEAVVARAARWLETPAEFPGVGSWLSRWLLHLIERRGPGWRDAVRLVRPPARDRAVENHPS